MEIDKLIEEFGDTQDMRLFVTLLKCHTFRRHRKYGYNVDYASIKKNNKYADFSGLENIPEEVGAYSLNVTEFSSKNYGFRVRFYFNFKLHRFVLLDFNIDSWKDFFNIEERIIIYLLRPQLLTILLVETDEKVRMAKQLLSRIVNELDIFQKHL